MMACLVIWVQILEPTAQTTVIQGLKLQCGGKGSWSWQDYFNIWPMSYYFPGIFFFFQQSLWNTSRFLFHPVLVDVSKNLWSFIWGRKISCHQTGHKTRRNECREYICVTYSAFLYMWYILLFGRYSLQKKIMWLKLIPLNMPWTLSLDLLSSLFFLGYNEDHSNVTCRLLAKQKKSVWPAGDVTWRCLGSTSLCPPGMCIIVHFSW